MASRRKVAKKQPQGVPEARRTLGRARPGQAMFPVTPPKSELPSGYGEALGDLKARIQQARLRTVLAANAAMLQLYWEMGRTILARQAHEGWGAKVIDRLSADLREAFPDMSGLSPRNLLFMRGFAEAYPDARIVKQLVSQLPWGHVVKLLQRVKAADARHWYMRMAIEEGWSRSVLEMQIERRLYERKGKAVTNFARTMPPGDSDMAAQIFKDPYLFDMLGTADPRREAEVEQALVDHVQKFLLELGAGFAFLGRQVPLEVGDSDFKVDLLFYHVRLHAYVVVELKATAFKPEYAGKMNFYLSAADDLLKADGDNPSIGLLLCKSKDRLQAEYALREIAKPIGVANWETALVEKLPKEFEGSLPTVEEIEAELGGGGAGNKKASPQRKPKGEKA
jgi:predicted nuclease of restriction endonuclease-like (RecB) superfamily